MTITRVHAIMLCMLYRNVLPLFIVAIHECSVSVRFLLAISVCPKFQMARVRYSLHLSQSVEYIKKLEKESAKSLQRAKPFYDVFKEARELQAKCRNAAVLYEKASQKHQAAKEVVAIAEVELFQRGGGNSTTPLNPAWQETLSHGVEKVGGCVRECMCVCVCGVCVRACIL